GADKVGQVVAIKKWNPETRRSRVDVLWPGPLTTPVAHRYGHRGKIELKCITPAPGGCYYRDHLAVLGKQETVAPKYKSGDKVNILLEVEEIQRLQEDHGGWTDQMDT
ncbi:E3 ubiquitin-protein ligase MIB2, partial [Biomphalaria glabrata]